MRDDELNITTTQTQTREVAEYTETKSFGSNKTAEETVSYDETKTSSNKVAAKKSGNSTLTKILSSITTGVVAAAAVVAVIAPTTIFASDKTVVKFNETSATDVSVAYNLSISNWSGNDLNVVLYNDFTNRTEVIPLADFDEQSTNEASEATADAASADKIEQTSNEAYGNSQVSKVSDGGEVSYVVSGMVQNLASDMKYTLAVKSGNTTLAEKSVRTLGEDEYLVSVFQSVDYACACDVDGYFHFTMNFVDENGWWKDFSATLTDAEGNVSSCVFTENLHSEQKIVVTLGTANDLVGTTALFRITCVSTQNNADGEQLVLFEQQVEI